MTDPVALAAAALLPLASVAFVARPFLRRAPAGPPPGEAEEGRLRLLEERDRALGALKELELDHRTGKVGDDEYRELVGPLRRQAAAALRALDAGS